MTTPVLCGKKRIRASTYEGENEQDRKVKIDEVALAETFTTNTYFQFYGDLENQQSMLQDIVRTESYYSAIKENCKDFHDLVVADIGAGSGILSLFALQAGAKFVYAVEASKMAKHACTLIAANPSSNGQVKIIQCKVEEYTLPEKKKVDVLISEPMGYLLVHERMIESYLIGRDELLREGGKMFPSCGRIHMAPFSWARLHAYTEKKACFWKGKLRDIELSSLYSSACGRYFSQPVVTTIDPGALMSSVHSHEIDFTSIRKEELCEIDMPFSFMVDRKELVHGLACWFDVQFNGSMKSSILTTAPGKPTTHWNQVLCLLEKPLDTLKGDLISGRLHMVANEERSYTIYLTMQVWSQERIAVQTSAGILELKDCFFGLKEAATLGDAIRSRR